jgi:hypothetical protein
MASRVVMCGPMGAELDHMGFHVTMCGVRGSFNCYNDLTTHLPSIRSYAPYAQVPRRLGAGAPLTFLRFALLARLHPVLGFYAI